MKTRLITLILALGAFLGTANMASAHRGCSEDWKQRMKSEKIAFLTSEVDITPEEAQSFWPVYNAVNKKKDAALQTVFQAHKALEQAINENKSEKEINTLLEQYLEAQENQREVENDAAQEYKKVLSTKKVAKLYLAEEKFRRQHIRRLHDKPAGSPQMGQGQAKR